MVCKRSVRFAGQCTTGIAGEFDVGGWRKISAYRALHRYGGWVARAFSFLRKQQSDKSLDPPQCVRNASHEWFDSIAAHFASHGSNFTRAANATTSGSVAVWHCSCSLAKISLRRECLFEQHLDLQYRARWFSVAAEFTGSWRVGSQHGDDRSERRISAGDEQFLERHLGVFDR